MLFDIRNVTAENFEAHALELFRFQYDRVDVYKRYVDLLNIDVTSVKHVDQIPFLPISLFKSHRVIANDLVEEIIFHSSTTTGSIPSKHFVADLNLYRTSCITAFKNFYGDEKDWCFLALLPSYLERGNSSLVWMVRELMNAGNNSKNGFYLNDFDALTKTVLQNETLGQKTMVIGVGYALLDWSETWTGNALNNTVLMETGGMKGRRKELVKSELHDLLQKTFGVANIHSEYGMSELLSQAYSAFNGIYRSMPWMKTTVRDINDPLALLSENQTGVLNIIDLANQYSCAFVSTEDLGRVYDDGSFEVLGRLDFSEMRGCNLMVD